MVTFEALEKAFDWRQLRLVAPHDGAGVLRLCGRTSALRFGSEHPFRPSAAERTGLFDLRARLENGTEILLHNALVTESTFHSRDHALRVYNSTEIFPNVVVTDARGVDADQRVKRTHFRIRDLSHFFHYHPTGELSAFELGAEQLALLKSLRRSSDVEEPPFQPYTLYYVNRIDELLEFRVEDRVYAIGWGFDGRSGFSPDTRASAYPIASITFDAPVDLETTLTRVWEWRRFFAQLAMAPLTFEAMDVLATDDLSAPRGALYLPNLEGERPAEKGFYDLHPGNLPLNRWADRHRLVESMRTWLARGEARRTFRSALDRVIERMDRRIDAHDVLELYAGMQSLEELESGAPLPKDTLTAMASAALAMATDPAITLERLKGVLGLLQRSSPARRVETLASRIVPPRANLAALVLKGASEIRNASAHGSVLSEQRQPWIGPTTSVLAALCACYDLQSCGVPLETPHGGPTVLARRLEDAARELELLAAVH
jgi:hypothetical protein